MIARASSGSRSAISSVEPLISANSAVTVLRSPSVVSEVIRSAAMRMPEIASVDGLAISEPRCGPRALPQSAQNLASGGLSEPHFEQWFDNWLPHSVQNFLPGSPSDPHLEQRILLAQLVEQRFASFRSAVSKPAVNQRIGERRPPPHRPYWISTTYPSGSAR